MKQSETQTVDPYKTDEPVSGNRSVYQTVTFYHIVEVPGALRVTFGVPETPVYARKKRLRRSMRCWYQHGCNYFIRRPMSAMIGLASVIGIGQRMWSPTSCILRPRTMARWRCKYPNPSSSPLAWPCHGCSLRLGPLGLTNCVRFPKCTQLYVTKA